MRLAGPCRIVWFMRGPLRLVRGAGSPFLWDSLLALLLAGLAQVELWQALAIGNYALRWAPNVAVTLLQTVPLAWRRRAPLTVLLVVASAVTVQRLAEVAGVAAQHPHGFVGVSSIAVLSSLICIYTVSAYGDRVDSAIAAGVAVTGPLLFRTPGLFPLHVVSEWWMLFGGAWLLGRVARWGWGSKSRFAVGQERLRIAREIHDVVASSVTVIAVQAGAARINFDADPGHGREALAAIESKSRQALRELRTLLGLLRSEDQEGPALAPQPSLEGLDDLIREVREAGLDVEMRTEGDPRPLPPGLDVSVYRIVQEALTNTLKHVGPTSAAVVIRYGPHDLEVEIVNEGPVAGVALVGPGSGLGILGMRERTALFGGSLRAAPRPQGGFGVKARLPLDASEP
jgi:signal transduction histidine kinase